jgi:flagellar biosynthetic protein FliR
MTTPFADLMGLFSAVLFFAMDMHLYLIRGIFTSYEVLPIATTVELASLIDALAVRVSTVFVWSLQLGAPFILYITVCNLLLGLANRLVPQVPIQFVMAPAILFGGLGLTLFVLTVAMERLMSRFTIGAFGL